MSSYYLLTGVTGLLGSYLVRDLLAHDIRLAVLVRDAPGESAVQRLERVMSRWETIHGRALPRPVLLCGDLNQPSLGLTGNEIEWLRRQCHSVIHSAASLTFVEDQRTGEPWRSNVQGTENVLQLCRAARIDRLFHVSTAYVCGLRSDRVLENELDAGQSYGNDYERSKAHAEKLIRQDAHIRSLTVFRPAIIVGDSRTGYTSTFHGFYTPLKILAPLLAKFDYEQLGADGFLEVLGMNGQEQKNLVPVDWVSQVMTHVICNESDHGRTYHITPDSRVSVRDMAEVGADALKEHLRANDKSGETQTKPSAVPAADNWKELARIAEQLSTQMQVYRAYLRDDPMFDTSNTQRLAGLADCPRIDHRVLRRLVRFALKANFGWPRSLAPPVPVAVEIGLKAAVSRNRPDPKATKFGLELTGPGGGRWILNGQDADLLNFEPGADPAEKAQSHLSTQTMTRLLSGQLSVTSAVSTGRLMVAGNDCRDREACIKLLTHVLKPHGAVELPRD